MTTFSAHPFRSPTSPILIDVGWRAFQCTPQGSSGWPSQRARHRDWNWYLGNRLWQASPSPPSQKCDLLTKVKASLYPSANVIGTDLSPIQPELYVHPVSTPTPNPTNQEAFHQTSILKWMMLKIHGSSPINSITFTVGLWQPASNHT